MSQKEENSLQSMYEYQRLVAPNGQEYVVRGAEVFCGWGEHTCALNLPVDHGEVTTDNRPLITVKDSTTKNVKGFGYCKLIGDTCRPSLSGWSNSSGNVKKIRDINTGDYEYAVTRSATANCAKQKGGQHGIVAFSSSGQVVPDYSDKKIEGAVDIVENIKGSWSHGGNNKKDFLGHIKVEHSGLYDLGINVTNNVSKYNGGSVFLYKKQRNKKTLKFLGAIEFNEHENVKYEKLKESVIYINTKDNSSSGTRNIYWTIWAGGLLLDKGADYYVEIDCPNVISYDYKLVCFSYINKGTIIETMNQLMCNTDAFMINTESAVRKINKAIDDANKINGVVAIGISGSVGTVEYISASGQLVIDTHGSIGVQVSLGYGAEIGESAVGTAYVAVYPGLADISEVEGFGMEGGGSIGEAFIGSAALLFSIDENGASPAGLMLGMGVGAEGNIGEAHNGLAYTFPTVRLGNIYTLKWEEIYGHWGNVYSLWEELYSQWDNK